MIHRPGVRCRGCRTCRTRRTCPTCRTAGRRRHLRELRASGCGRLPCPLFPGARRLEEGRHRSPPLELAGLEQADRAVLAVVPRLAVHPPGAQSLDRFADQAAAGAAQVFDRQAFEDRELRPEARGELADLAAHRLRLDPDAFDLGDDLGQRHQAAECRSLGRAGTVGAVGEELDPVHHPDGQRLAALRAAAVAAAGLGGRQAHAAGAVAVEVVLALLGEELHRTAVAVAGLERPAHGEVVEVGVEDAGLAAEHRRRVGVGARRQGEAVEAGEAPVHRRVGGEAGLDGEDVLGEVAVALLDRVEARLRAEDGEPRRPDVGRHEIGAGTALEDDLEQVARVEAEDRPPVGGDVADPPEAVTETPGGLEVGGVDQVVDLARPLALLVDGRDLDLEQEAYRPAARRRQPPFDLALDLRPQAEEPGLGGYQLVAELVEPGGVGEVAGRHHRQTLAPGPQGEVLEVAVAAGGAGVLGVDVEVGVERHGGVRRAALLYRSSLQENMGFPCGFSPQIVLPNTSTSRLRPEAASGYSLDFNYCEAVREAARPPLDRASSRRPQCIACRGCVVPRGSSPTESAGRQVDEHEISEAPEIPHVD